MGDDLTYLPSAVRSGTHGRMTTLQKAEAIRKLEIFSEASVEDLYHLASIAQEVDFAADAVIFHKDDVSDAFYLIVQGRVECSSEPGAKPVVMETGQAVGLHSVLTREERQTTAKALENTFALAIGGEDFYNLLSCNSETTVSLIKYFVKKVGIGE